MFDKVSKVFKNVKISKKKVLDKLAIVILSVFASCLAVILLSPIILAFIKIGGLAVLKFFVCVLIIMLIVYALVWAVDRVTSM